MFWLVTPHFGRGAKVFEHLGVTKCHDPEMSWSRSLRT